MLMKSCAGPSGIIRRVAEGTHERQAYQKDVAVEDAALGRLPLGALDQPADCVSPASSLRQTCVLISGYSDAIRRVATSRRRGDRYVAWPGSFTRAKTPMMPAATVKRPSTKKTAAGINGASEGGHARRTVLPLRELADVRDGDETGGDQAPERGDQGRSGEVDGQAQDELVAPIEPGGDEGYARHFLPVSHAQVKDPRT